MSKAPDKIYVRDFGNSLCQMWSGIKGKKRNDVDIEYIRKDALIAWMYDRQELEFDDIIEGIKAL